MELRHLKHFLAVAQSKHFHQAAMQLNLAQPSLSRSIQKMEELLGVKLLDRSSRSVTLTPMGEIVVSHGTRIVRDVEFMKAEIQAIQELGNGDLSIGASAIPLNSIVGPVMGQFIHAYPKVSVDLKVGQWHSLYRQLYKAEIGLFIAETKATELDKKSELEIIQLPPFKVIFCVRHSHPLAKCSTVSLNDLKSFPLAIPSAMPKGITEQFDDLFRKSRQGFAGLIKFEQFQAIKDSLSDCDLIALAPDISVEKDMKQGELTTLPVSDMPEIQASFSIVYLKHRQLLPSERAFVHYIQQAL
ncbi:LysR family transcriptional regulator [Shewanella sp. WXL01]|uniref:LysR family transcriptional regulator n=1 Tax=Shewanella maritima TaxID=2520507 RepID=A0A411PJK0_9GAMM|nr:MULTISPECIES: LysR family transcriptional regulator [Shewanella]NKF50796.1 LysR family transcriptional regulator [Shewanella sp. WXL01]QBF83781.1 LysR family transcriptional regulator [Shewanella maritima]